METDNERRLELHFPPLIVGGDKIVSTQIPLVATRDLASDEWLRPEYLVLHGEVSATCFQITTLSLRHSEFEGHEIVLPMHPQQQDLGETGVTFLLEASEAPPSSAYVFLEVRNRTGQELTFRGSMTLIAVRGTRRPSAPFTPIPPAEPDIRESTPPKSPSWNERLSESFAIMIHGLRELRQEYVSLKKTYEELDAAKSYLEQDAEFYPPLKTAQPESIKQIIAQSFREGLGLASFPLRLGSMMADKGFADLKDLLEGRKEKLEGKETIVSCRPTNVEPGSDAALIIEPLSGMIPTRIVVLDEIANDFSLVDIKVAKNCQLIASFPIPCSMLAGLGDSVLLKMEEAGPGRPICINVRNTSAKTSKFQAVVVGYVV